MPSRKNFNFGADDGENLKKAAASREDHWASFGSAK
jgi:hypothetical protein